STFEIRAARQLQRRGGAPRGLGDHDRDQRTERHGDHPANRVGARAHNRTPASRRTMARILASPHRGRAFTTRAQGVSLIWFGLKRLVCIVLLFAAASAMMPRIRRKMTDFEVDWRTGARWAAAEPLYRPEDGHYQYKYLPVFGAAMAPFARL